MAVLAACVALAPPAAADPPAADLPLAGTVIAVDPGHNGGNSRHTRRANRLVDAGNGIRKPCNTSGTSTAAGYPEHAYTLDVARRVARHLRRLGATVVLTRTTDRGVGPCIDRRPRIAARAGADVLLSIHADANATRAARGFHVIRSSAMAGGRADVRASRRLALSVRNAYRQRTGMPYSTYTGGGDAITPRRDIGTLNLATMPAVMIETGNMRHPADSRRLSSARFRARAAAALATGLQRFLATRATQTSAPPADTPSAVPVVAPPGRSLPF